MKNTSSGGILAIKIGDILDSSPVLEISSSRPVLGMLSSRNKCMGEAQNSKSQKVMPTVKMKTCDQSRKREPAVGDQTISYLTLNALDYMSVVTAVDVHVMSLIEIIFGAVK